MPGKPARELELYEDLAAILANPLTAPHLVRLMKALRRQEPEVYAALRRITHATLDTPQEH